MADQADAAIHRGRSERVQDRFDAIAWYGALRRIPPGTLADDGAHDTLWLYLFRLRRLRNGRDDVTLDQEEHEIALRVALDETGSPEATHLQREFADLIREHRARRLRRYAA